MKRFLDRLTICVLSVVAYVLVIAYAIDSVNDL